MFSKKNMYSEVYCERVYNRFCQGSAVLPVLVDDIWCHIASCSPDAKTWLNLALAVPKIGRWSISDRGIAVSNKLFSAVEYSGDPYGRSKRVKFRKNGKLHRDGDKPAVVWDRYEPGDQFRPIQRITDFFKNGLRYRDGDLPTSVGFFKVKENDVSWHVFSMIYTKEIMDRNENTVHIIGRDFSKGPECVLFEQRGLTLEFYKSKEPVVGSDENEPSVIFYSRLEKRKISGYGRLNESPCFEVNDTVSVYDLEATMRELTKDIIFNDEDAFMIT